MSTSITAWASWAAYRNSEQRIIDIPSGGDMRSALFFPADYSVGMANLGYHYIYRSLRELGVAVERFFLSPIPYRSVEDDTMFERFSMFFGSVSYEADVPLFAGWLRKGGVNPQRSMRNSDCEPLVGVGGAITYINPLSLTGLADFIVLGDGLPVMPFIVEVLRKNLSRERLLQQLAEHGSILVPAVHLKQASRSFDLKISRQLNISDDYGHSSWIANKTVFGRTLLVELQRGCKRGCRYCTLPSCFSPFRQRAVEKILDDIRMAAELADFDKVGLVTPEASDYRDLSVILRAIEGLNKGVSFASLRADGLTADIVSSLVRGGRYSITLAPESGDDDLRRTCGKNFTNDQLLSIVSMAKDEGITALKLYFMIGLPNEDDKHVLSIAELCEIITAHTGIRLTVSVSPFVPKPFTAWRNEPFAGEKALKRKYSLLVKSFKGALRSALQGVNIKEACLEFALSWASTDISEKIASGVHFKRLHEYPEDKIGRLAIIDELSRLGIAQNR